MEHKFIIGVDIGGTKIAVALCNLNGHIIAKVKTDTNTVAGKDKVIQKIVDCIYQVIELSGITIDHIAGIGIGSPGPLNVSKGIVLYVATLQWENVPIRDIIRREFNVPVFLENDCNAAAFGELWLGAGRGYSNLIYITLSTGIGSGIIINKGIYRGKHDAAGEFGHICVEDGGRICSCGNNGCLQAYASGTSIAKMAEEYISKHKDSSLLQYVNDEFSRIDCLMVEKAADSGDVTAIDIWTQAGEKLGHGISILLQLLDPEIVIIGGGVSKALDLFYEPMIDYIKKHVYRIIYEDMVIVQAQLGQDAGVIGAAMIAVKELGLNDEFFYN